ncbi:MAG: SDR family oxidoreductase, partial [Pseudomonadota bacterium]
AQLSRQKIRVNAICPGLIATSIFGASLGLPREVADQMAARVAEHAAGVQPVPKAGLPDDIAQAALYLASDASAFVSGTHLVVDGGITVGGRHSWDTTSPSPFALMFGEDSPFAAPAADPA